MHRLQIDGGILFDRQKEELIFLILDEKILRMSAGISSRSETDSATVKTGVCVLVLCLTPSPSRKANKSSAVSASFQSFQNSVGIMDSGKPLITSPVPLLQRPHLNVSPAFTAFLTLRSEPFEFFLRVSVISLLHLKIVWAI
jgi:hypothetical protein